MIKEKKFPSLGIVP